MKFFRIYIRLWMKHQISMRAAALTYTFILSLVPALALCLSAFSLFVDIRELSSNFKVFLLKQLAAGAGSTVVKYLDTFLAHVRFKTIGYFGFCALLITSLLLLSNIEDTINRIWAIQKKKQIWKRVLVYNLILFIGPVTVSISVATTTVVTKFFPDLITKANMGAMLITATFLALIYKIFPNERVSWRACFITGVIVAFAIEIAKWGYAEYTARALFYNTVYGGLAALPFFLIWIYVNWTIFLGGALLCYMIQHRKTLYARGV